MNPEDLEPGRKPEQEPPPARLEGDLDQPVPVPAPAAAPAPAPVTSRRGMRTPALRTVIAVIVTLVWASAYLISVADPAFHPDPGITSVMVLIVAYLFVTERESRKHNGNGNGNGNGSNKKP